MSLDIGAGEFFSLLGPSGSGKTTVLRMIAGFERPTTGSIHLGGDDVTDRPPFDRDVNTVFQDYALFPHMTRRAERRVRLARPTGPEGRAPRPGRGRARRRCGSTGFEARKPNQLSGGQRQRVALARALVNRPRVLLLDEPLGALDLKLREEMQVELKQIQRDVGITFVFVTHDQGEALTMSNRVAVFNEGRIEQVGRADRDLRATGQSRSSPASSVPRTSSMEAAARDIVGMDGPIAVRPEKVRILAATTAADPDDVVIGGVVRDVQYHGGGTTFRVVLDAGPEFVVESQNLAVADTSDVSRGRKVELAFRRGHVFRVPEPARQGEGVT